jgi:hypothetical protein
VLKDLLPGLAIASCCRLEERYLVVEGKIRTYRIHLGSGNIQMEPNDQYLCIVRDRAAASKQVRLPFEGDDTLSAILSKAFMLADDDAARSILDCCQRHRRCCRVLPVGSHAALTWRRHAPCRRRRLAFGVIRARDLASGRRHGRPRLPQAVRRPHPGR